MGVFLLCGRLQDSQQTASQLFQCFRRGMKFLTYAAPAIRNAMMDMVRDAFAAFEQRMVTEDKDGILLPACFAG